MPGMPVTMGQPMPGVVPNMPHGTRSGCSPYAGTYSAAADPMTYFSAIAGQSGFILAKQITISTSIRNRSFR